MFHSFWQLIEKYLWIPFILSITVGIFCSGQIPLRSDGTFVGGSIEEQTKQVIENLQAVLQAAGTSLDNIVKTTIFLTDLNDFQIVNKVYGEYFKDNPPDRATIQVSALPKVEIEAIAVA